MEGLLSLFNDYTFRVVALGSALLGITSGVLGCFAILKKESLLGDGVSHAALPGVVLAFLLTNQKHTLILLLGAAITGLLATFCIKIIVKYSTIKFDGALALIMSVFFGFGIALLTYAQRLPTANQAGLSGFIYGQASTLLVADIYIMSIVSIILLSIVVLLWKEFKLVIFDSIFATSIGYPTRLLNNLLSLLIVITIVLGLQTVGVILMSAMLIAPGVAARQWTNKLSVMLLYSAIFGAVSGVIGTAISSSIPRVPTGPTIVICLSSITIISLLIAPNRGILHEIYMRNKTRKRLLKDKEGCHESTN